MLRNAQKLAVDSHGSELNFFVIIRSLFDGYVQYPNTKKQPLINSSIIINGQHIQKYFLELHESLDIKQWIEKDKSNNDNNNIKYQPIGKPLLNRFKDQLDKIIKSLQLSSDQYQSISPECSIVTAPTMIIPSGSTYASFHDKTNMVYLIDTDPIYHHQHTNVEQNTYKHRIANRSSNTTYINLNNANNGYNGYNGSHAANLYRTVDLRYNPMNTTSISNNNDHNHSIVDIVMLMPNGDIYVIK